MKKMKAAVTALLTLTVSSFLFMPRLLRMITRLQRLENRAEITQNHLTQDADPVLLATVQFDNQAIEFYYDINQIENNGLYYSSYGKKQRITYPQNLIISADGQFYFYADFANEFEVYQNEERLNPYQTIEISLEHLSITIPLYQLNKNENILLKPISAEHDYSFACSIRSLCSHIETMHPDELGPFIEKWKKTSWPDGVKYNQLQSLFYIDQNAINYHYGTYSISTVGVKTVQDKKGIHYIVKETNANEFYEVTQAQLDEFYLFLKNYQN